MTHKNAKHSGLPKQTLTAQNTLPTCLSYGVKSQERTKMVTKIEMKQEEVIEFVLKYFQKKGKASDQFLYNLS